MSDPDELHDDPLFTEGDLFHAIEMERLPLTEWQITDLYRRMVDEHMVQVTRGQVEDWLDEATNAGEDAGRDTANEQTAASMGDAIDRALMATRPYEHIPEVGEFEDPGNWLQEDRIVAYGKYVAGVVGRLLVAWPIGEDA